MNTLISILLAFHLMLPIPQIVTTARSAAGFTWVVGTNAGGNEVHDFTYSGPPTLSLTPVRSDHSVIFCWDTSIHAGNSINDSVHTWIPIQSELTAGYGNLDAWYAQNTSTTPVTIVMGTSGGSTSGQCVEVYKSTGGTIAVDTSNSETAGTALLGVSLTTSQPNEILLLAPIPGSAGSFTLTTGTQIFASGASGAYITEASSGTYTDPSLTQMGGGSGPGGIAIALQ